MFFIKKIIIYSFALVFILFISQVFGHKKANVYYFNLDNKLVREDINAGAALNFLYNNFLGKIIRPVLTQKIVSKIPNFYNNSRLSKHKIKPFIKKYKIDTSEFLKKGSDFKSFNDFFTRKLKPNVRPIDRNPELVVSPADSKLFVIPDVSKEVKFFVKNKKFNLENFLKNKDLAKKYSGGVMLIFRLAPLDYHRYHFPFDCIPEKPVKINGKLESVNSLVYKSGIQPLTENERQLIKLKTQNFGSALLVSVGAMFVGKIVHTFKPENQYKKGNEVGYFEFGGSTLVLLFEKDKIKIKDKFLINSKKGYETQVKMGQVVNCL